MIAFLSIVFTVFLSIGFHSLDKVSNQYRYSRTPPRHRSRQILEKRRKIPLKVIIPAAFCLAWFVVHFVIFGN